MGSAVLERPAPTSASWSGVVAIERPEWPGPDAACKVFSARAIEFNGQRAVLVHLPYSMVSQFFEAGDEDTVYAEATVQGEHLQLHGKTNFKEWAYHSAARN